MCCGWNYNTFYLGASPGSTFGVGDTSQYALYGTDCSKPSQQVPVDSWSSYNTSIASVNGSGLVTGVAAGSTTIEADTSVYGGQNFQQCAEYNPQCPTGNPPPKSGGVSVVQLTLSMNQYSSIFVGTDPNLAGANSIFATVSPTGGSFTEASSASGDTFSNVTSGGPGWVVHTTTPSTSVGDRTITVTYTVNGGSVSKSLHVTAREFAYATNSSPSNLCGGYGWDYLYTYTPDTHPDKVAVQPGIGIDGTAVSESFNPQPPSGYIIGPGGLDANSQFKDHVETCSSSPLSISTITTTQSISIEGYAVRENTLTFADSGLTYVNKGPTQ